LFEKECSVRISRLLLSLTASALLALPAMAASCESLASLALKDAKITTAETVAAGAFVQPGRGARGGAPKGGFPNAKGGNAKGRGGPGRGANFSDLPEFCRIAATLTPTSDSDIKVEIWLPMSGWNGKYQAVGNGGWAGTISYPAMATALRSGYATSSTDTGHTGGSASFVPGHPEKLVDYAYRSEHEMVVKSKELIQAFYGSPARYSYWNGCSTGGKQGLTEAQRYPDDFDGIIAGAPANYMIHLHVWSVWVNQVVHETPDSMLPPAKLAVLHDGVIKACDALDKVSDGVIENPTKCHYDPKELLCKGADGPACLTAAQVEAAKKLYTPPVNPRTKEVVFPTFEPGSELAWNTLAGNTPASVATDTFRYWISNNDPNWDYMKLNLDSDVANADKIDNHMNNATDPNLKPFFSHKGKLMMYHGWNDQLIAPMNSINYYSSVVKSVGNSAKDSMRLFMVPGMTHCQGGAGPSSFDAVTLMEQWVEQGKAPEKMIASHLTNGQVDRTRPLCAYPQVATYNGSGSTDEAANFSCKAP
jgi:Tannase and feruloyl esterase